MSSTRVRWRRLHDTVSAHEHLVSAATNTEFSLRNRLRCDASNALARRAARILDAPFQTSENVVREGSWVRSRVCELIKPTSDATTTFGASRTSSEHATSHP